MPPICPRVPRPAAAVRRRFSIEQHFVSSMTDSSKNQKAFSCRRLSMRFSPFGLRYAWYRIEQQSIFTVTKKDLTPFGYHAADQNRTDDTGIFSPLLYRLSYSGITFAREGIYSKRPDYCQPECDKKLRHMLGKA
jgi:hypothetical protein